MAYTGRKKILCDEPVITEQNVAKVLTDALSVHMRNRAECDYLYRYYKGEQPILRRVKEIRPEINNKMVENRANEIVEFKSGYLCGEPLQYVSRGTSEDITDGISKLNNMMLLCGKSAKDKELSDWMYICGIGCRMIMTNAPYINSDIVPKLNNRRTDFTEDEAPFDIYTLDPRSAFVVYHSGLGEKPVMGVKYVVQQDKKIVYSVYTPTHYFELTSDNLISGLRVDTSKTQERPLKAIPIVEYPLNSARQGAFEVVEPILNAINEVQSNRLDGVRQFIESLVVLYNADISDEDAKLLREAGLIKLKSSGAEKADIKIMAEQLNQQQTQTLVDYMHQTILDIVGMPNRNGGNSTSDTGTAVQMRDGWETAEARAKSDEIMFKKAEIEFLKIALQIIRGTVGTPLLLSDIEVKFSRRNYANLLTKAQALQIYLACGLSNEDALAIAGVGTDPLDIAKRMSEVEPPLEVGGAIA